MEKEAEFFNKKNNRGQVTIFIIIAVIVVAIGALIWIFYPQIKSVVGTGTDNPSAFLETCIKSEIENAVQTISLQGGSINPENYHSYLGDNIEYLCYTSDYYTPCIVQQPLLKNHIENEINNEISEEAQACLQDLKTSFEKKGYDVNLVPKNTSVELLPERVVTTFNVDLTLKKSGTVNYDSFRVVLNNNLYELIGIANSIINWETTYGDADTGTYMDYYHYLKVEKKKRDDNSKIYILTNKDTGNMFQFASRSIVLPPGI